MNHSTNQSIHHSTASSMKRSMIQWINHWVNEWNTQWMQQWTNQLMSPWLQQWTNHPLTNASLFTFALDLFFLLICVMLLMFVFVVIAWLSRCFLGDAAFRPCSWIPRGVFSLVLKGFGASGRLREGSQRQFAREAHFGRFWGSFWGSFWVLFGVYFWCIM